MGVDLDEVLGPRLMAPGSREAVIAILRALPLPATERRQLYMRWARMVGISVTPEDVERVASWSSRPDAPTA